MMTENTHELTEDELDALTGLEAGGWITLTLDDGTELTAYVTDAHHDRPEQPPGEPVPVPGNLNVNLELPNSEYTRLNEQRAEDLNTQSGSFSTRERRRGELETPITLAFYDPVVEDAAVVRDEWTALGAITAVELTEEPEDGDGDA